MSAISVLRLVRDERGEIDGELAMWYQLGELPICMFLRIRAAKGFDWYFVPPEALTFGPSCRGAFPTNRDIDYQPRRRAKSLRHARKLAHDWLRCGGTE